MRLSTFQKKSPPPTYGGRDQGVVGGGRGGGYDAVPPCLTPLIRRWYAVPAPKPPSGGLSHSPPEGGGVSFSLLRLFEAHQRVGQDLPIQTDTDSQIGCEQQPSTPDGICCLVGQLEYRRVRGCLPRLNPTSLDSLRCGRQIRPRERGGETPLGLGCGRDRTVVC